MADKLLRIHGIAYDELALIHHGENTTFRAKQRGAEQGQSTAFIPTKAGSSEGEQAQKTDTRSYLCRIHRPGYQSEASIRSEIVWIDYLRNAGLGVPAPLSVGEEAVFTVSAPGVDDRFGVLFAWIHGRFQSSLSLKRARVLGGFMAQMHLHAIAFEPPPHFFRPRLDANGLWTNMGGRVCDLPPDDQPLFDAVFQELREAERRLGTRSDRFGMIHGDFHLGNRLFQGETPYAIDFDDSGFGWFMFDIAVCLTYHRNDPLFEALVDAFIDGYQEHKSISDVELEMFPLFMAVRRAQIALWVLGRDDNPAFVARLPELLERTRTSLRAYLIGSSST